MPIRSWQFKYIIINLDRLSDSFTVVQMTHHEVCHPKIGRIRGLLASEGVAQFLGIRYAALKDRFSRGILCDYSPGGEEILDATTVGSVFKSYSM